MGFVTRMALSKKRRKARVERSSADDLLSAVSERMRKPVGKVSRWAQDNPDAAKIFFEACEKAIEKGIPVSYVVDESRSVLGGPPGSYSTVMIAVRNHVEGKE